MASRVDGRRPQDLRTVSLTPYANPYAEGSCEARFGKTHVLCTATLEREVPAWLKGTGRGWLTAEYGMLPRATHTRTKREAASGKQGGRTLEIQRLIGRALRQAVDLPSLGELTVRLDCDVLCADGGTRCASICGAWVALVHALNTGVKSGLLTARLPVAHIVAISAGIVSGESLLDLCYEEDSAAEFDLNLVFGEDGRLIEVQGTGEKKSASWEELSALVELSKSVILPLVKLQQAAICG